MTPFMNTDIVAFSLEEKEHGRDEFLNCMKMKTETRAVRFW